VTAVVTNDVCMKASAYLFTGCQDAVIILGQPAIALYFCRATEIRPFERS
jgi:hypothetical protein